MRSPGGHLVPGATALLAGTGQVRAQPIGACMLSGSGQGSVISCDAGSARGDDNWVGSGMSTPAAYLANLKAGLAITRAQEPAWNGYGRTVRTMVSQMQSMHAAALPPVRNATWEDRQEMMNRMFGSRDSARNRVEDAAHDLMRWLTPEQQMRATALLRGLTAHRAADGAAGR